MDYKQALSFYKFIVMLSCYKGDRNVPNSLESKCNLLAKVCTNSFGVVPLYFLIVQSLFH